MTRRDRLGRLVTTRPVAVLMIFLAAVVFGYFSYERLPVNLMPKLDYPTLTVRTVYPGAAPEEVENDVSRPIEAELGVISGLVKIKSISRAGISDVVLEFGWNTSASDAAQQVLEKLDLVILPAEAQRPLILHYDPSLEPVIELSVSGRGARFEGEAGQRRLRRLADLQIKRALEPIEGVAAVRIRGGLEEQIHVLLQEEQLRRTGISIEQIIDRLRQENVSLAGGMIEEGRTEFMVRTVGEFSDVDEIGDTVITIVGGRDVRLRDLGRVELGHKDREVLTRTDGGESVQIEIFKEADANVVALSDRIRDAIGSFTVADAERAPVSLSSRARRNEGLAARLAREEGVELRIVADRSLFIRGSIGEVRDSAVLGGLLATLVLFLFLRDVRTTLIIAVSIPISLLVTFAPLNLLGVSLNIMSLGGLAMGIGMLVDSSIVVLESIHRCREEGDELVAAAIRGTSEVRGAVTASILTTIAVFFPMVFVRGIAGQAFGDLGLAVVISLLASLAVALFFIPMLASRTGGSDQLADTPVSRSLRRMESLERFRARRGGSASRLRLALVETPRLITSLVLETAGKLLLLLIAIISGLSAFLLGRVGGAVLRLIAYLPLTLTDWTMRLLSRTYPVLLRRALDHPVAVSLLVLACVWGSWQMMVSMDSELLPEVRQGEFTVEVELPVGTSVTETDAVLAPIERAVLAEREHIQSLIVTVGRDPSRGLSADEGENTAKIKVLLDASAGRQTEREVVSRLRQRFAGIPDLEARISRPVLFSFKTPVEVEINGDDLQRLKLIGQQAEGVMAAMPELADVELSLKQGAPEVQIRYDRDLLASYNLRISDVARLVRSKVQGTESTRFNMKDRRIPVIVRLAAEDRETLDDVRGIVVNPGDERAIPLAAVADVSLGEGPSEVRRIDGRRVAVISSNIASGSLSGAVSKIQDRLDSAIDWPFGMSYFITGQNEEWERSRASLWLALGLSVFLVYVIMAAQFESLIHPFIIMLTIPLAFVGTLGALQLAGASLSIVVFLGAIMLAGIVVNNAIVLVDYINRLRLRGYALDEAIIRAGRVRLRPILMTSATTVLGLLPMAIGLGQGAELRTPMALAVIGGLISSTILTLLVIPTIYYLADRALARLLGRGSVERRAEPTGEPGADDAESLPT